MGNIPAEVLDELLQLQADVVPREKADWKNGTRFFDYALHLMIAEYCGNLPMQEAIRRYWRYKRLSYREGQNSEDDYVAEYHQHADILECLVNGDGPGAKATMLKHLIEMDEMVVPEQKL